MAYQIGNYALVANGINNSPESLDEMLKPYAYHTKVYDDTQEEFNKLYDRGNVFNYLSRTLPEGSQARQMYETYMNDLKSASKGLDSGYVPRQQLSQMKRRFSGEIGQLEQASKNRDEDLNLMLKQQTSDPTTIFETDLGDIDSYLDGRRHYGRTTSGAMLAKQAADATRNFQGVLTNVTMGQIDDYTNSMLQQYGLTPQDVAQYAANPTADNQQRLLAVIGENILRSNGIDKWTNPNAINQAREAIANGMWSSIGKSGMTTFDNYEARRKAAATANNKNSSSGKTDTPRAPRYQDIVYVSRGGTNTKAYQRSDEDLKDDDIASGRGAIDVDLVVDNSGKRYIAIKGRNSGYTYSILPYNDKTKRFEYNGDTKSQKRSLRYLTVNNKGKKVYLPSVEDAFARDFNSSYDSEWDDQNMAALTKDVLNVINREQSNEGFRNYQWYFSPDNASSSNNAGGFWREPLNVDMPSNANVNGNNTSNVEDDSDELGAINNLIFGNE